MASAGTAELLLGGIVMLGASVQWLTGMGFALIAVPALVLILGTAQGVTLANVAAGAISLVGLTASWRLVRIDAMIPLIVAAGCTVPAGSWVAARLPEAVLLAAIGMLTTLAVAFVMGGVRIPALAGARGAVAAGAVGGFMNSAAGVGGPPYSLYAVNAGWPVREFVPNAQFYGVMVNLFSVTANGAPRLSGPAWSVTVAALVTGALLGRQLASRVPEEWVRRLIFTLALTGGLSVLIKGIQGML
ncbi:MULTISPECIES: sulfite exporter TauE/SafE family protein [Streptomyces]|uniref:Probable membrane transporter protein n=1 Tax=Streptomyces stelliscabiei TaxID=146820 RepID=A0A8I0P1L5_9ACTN|nr:MULTISPECIES: sulfite exporter TauE/SafE family protein [Streptomyces]KND45879.1 membrane protein [Streptomyces stelliscabiei]MBE1594360.1 putative membrane protein YfcA [Streptomyces stelliscabiei]MDX2522058.1 sulfite exporter TauE/SafE family protein [Streptomyces stelliscabiei]MDX2557967.1 sulfite exporter TauE/SafE family protein [Streptomyces stelliscabiei]MDX2617768.1 sulfite exporter TauE/SafE family protein [Streptomyces stelliscabiei]